MAPVWQKIDADAVTPYYKREIQTAGGPRSRLEPLREFLFKQTRKADLALFSEIAGDKEIDPTQVPASSVIPAFVISELKTAFQMAFLIYVPFLILDLVVASILMSMGMMFLPPVLISLPFKLVLFVLVDGWNLSRRFAGAGVLYDPGKPHRYSAQRAASGRHGVRADDPVRPDRRCRGEHFSSNHADQRFYLGVCAQSAGDGVGAGLVRLVDVANVFGLYSANDSQSADHDRLSWQRFQRL